MDECYQIEGRNAVLELLESKRDVNKIFVQAGEKHGSIMKIISKAKANGVVVSEINRKSLDEMSEARKSSRSYCHCSSY